MASKSKFGKKYQVPDGMPLSVFNDRYARTVNGKTQNFADRVTEMVLGNTMLDPDLSRHEVDDFLECAASGLTPLSGRHLQHGDNTQSGRNIEVFTNCSTAAFSFLSFYLLLNGSGVGRDYSTESCRVDWEFMPNVRLVLHGGLKDDGNVAEGAHPDFKTAFSEFGGFFDSLNDATHKYDSESEDVRWVRVKDSREGWAEVIATLETAAFHRNHKDSLFIFDFSGVRPAGSPINGMQNRPAQGPLPLMRAMAKIITIKGAKMKPWKQALFIDHYLAASVVMGNVRRCLPKGTLVHLKRGLVPIENVQIGDMALTSDGTYHQVVENIKQGTQKLLTINTQIGAFRCTGKHRVAVLTGFGIYDWKRAEQLCGSDRLVFVDHTIPGVETSLPSWSDASKTSELVIPTLTTEVAWFLGALHGNGYVRYGKPSRGRKCLGSYISISISNDEYHDSNLAKVTAGFAAFGVDVHEQPSSDGCRKYRSGHRQLAHYLHANFKKLKSEFVVPDCILLASPEIKSAYLAGLLDTDNSVKTRPTNLMTNVYHNFLVQVRSVYASLGIPTVLKPAYGDDNRPEHWQKLWVLNLIGNCAIARFKELVQPFATKHVVEHDGSSTYSFGFPTSMVLGSSLKSKHYKGKWTTQSQQMTYDCAVRCGVKTDNLIPIKVDSIVDEGVEAETYDLSIPDRSEFVVHGLLVHNSARMATKWWRDRDIIEFVDVKRGGFLWSANNSVLVDNEFWEGAKNPKPSHARRVFEAAVGASYYDATGEPGMINIDLINDNKDGFDQINSSNYLNPKHGLKLHPKTYEMIDKVLTVLKASVCPFITNPCIPLWAPLLTPNGIRKLGDVNVGDQIWGNGRWTTVVKKWSTGVKKVYRYRTTAGVFYGTECHRIVQNGEKVPVSEAQSIDVARGLSELQLEIDAGACALGRSYKGGHIPDEILYGPMQIMASFLHGLMASQQLVACDVAFEQIQMMASALGVTSELLVGLGHDKDAITVSNAKTSYVVAVEFVSEEEVFDITVEDESNEHVFWSGGHLVSNCGEIVLSKFGGYCVIGDVVLSRAVSPEAAIKAVKLTAKALIRTNTMPALYQTEVNRTNRIGVGLTGIFEYAWKHFKLSFLDLIGVYNHVFKEPDDCVNKDAMAFWEHVDDLRETVETTAIAYSKQLGLSIPHTFTTIKPSGTISKVMSSTEGAHLPPYLYYIRWVICGKNTDKHHEYIKRGYPIKDVSHAYTNCVVVGFPTKHPSTEVIPDNVMLTASDVTPEDQFKWVKLIEKFWFGDGKKNNQVSYTLKYDNNKVTHDQFANLILEWQSKVRCCSVMPFTEKSAYAYLPEEKIDKETYESLIASIDRIKLEEYSEEELLCPGGSCPIEQKL